MDNKRNIDNEIDMPKTKNVTKKKRSHETNVTTLENDLRKYLEPFQLFNGNVFSHLVCAQPGAKYNIPSGESLEIFYKLYSRLIGKTSKLFFVELPCEYGPLIIDFDYNYKSDDNSRKYTYDTISNMINFINKILCDLFGLDNGSEKLMCLVFEKKKPTIKIQDKDGMHNYKDGFHIIYSFIITSKLIRYFILFKLGEIAIKTEFLNDLIEQVNENTIKNIFDNRLVEHNGLTMYGSKKQHNHMYVLTHIINADLTEQELGTFSKLTIVEMCSNRSHSKETSLTLRKKYNSDDMSGRIKNLLISKKYIKRPKSDISGPTISKDARIDKAQEFKPDQVYNDISVEKKKEINLATKLVNILDPKRSENWGDWIRVGYALHYVHPSLLNVWKKFSMQCSEKYNERECEDIWTKAKNSTTNMCTIASLHWLAKRDDLNQYYSVLVESINDILLQAENKQHFSIAKAIYEYYKYEFKCVIGTKKTRWYHFANGRWHEDNDGSELSKKVSEDFTNEYSKINEVYCQNFREARGNDRDKFMEKAQNITDLIRKLLNHSFKTNVIAECKILFKDNNFEKLLNSKTHLLGFDDGVYDLSINLFREGSPDDYMTFSV